TLRGHHFPWNGFGSWVRPSYSCGESDPSAATQSSTPAGRHTNRRMARLPTSDETRHMIPAPAPRATLTLGRRFAPLTVREFQGPLVRAPGPLATPVYSGGSRLIAGGGRPVIGG